MKKKSKILYCNIVFILILLLVGSTSNTNETSKTSDHSASTENKYTPGTDISKSNAPDKNSSATSDNQTNNRSTITNLTTEASNGNSVSESNNNRSLAKYSSKKIEYKRIWLQLGPNQNIDELDVIKIKAGDQLNPNDKTSGKYPEDVTQISGSRLVDGSVTYSSNGDGTINVYNVPHRWDGINPAGTEFYKDIIKNEKLVYVNPGENEKLIRLIKKIVYTTR